MPPEDLKDLDTAAQSLFGSLYIIGICYLDIGKEIWMHEQRVPLIRMPVRDFERDLIGVRHELKKVC